MIKSIAIARKIGFSSALRSGVISAYNEAAKYQWGDDKRMRIRMLSAFYGSFKEGIKAGVEARMENIPVKYEFLEPAHKALFS